MKRQWSDHQKAIICKEFGRFIRTLNKLPGKDLCMSVIKLHPHLFAGRSWRNIKDYVRNSQRKYFSGVP